ncbi:CheR family methyltransferase [Erythrobacter sp. EC-HK427]|uniref:CheR family methyltransferase n=1 Tax=Erythrobacter sp. EC-HK427 TaxID=2038396 RepID=UPI00125397E2|nr:protein-glutamate O-methyltransferase CheR [Erythrobacter sp. EC-HK427]VVT00061.1 Protein-glutamate O-methyltransferase [Erythrobacter sp. EC-HK427]
MQVTPAAVRILAELLEEFTGQELTQTRQWRVGTALSSVMREHDCADLNALAARIAGNYRSPLARQVVEALLNNETYFFRDLAVFQDLQDTVLPALAQARAEKRRLSIWCAGCSTGQEALSLAMMLAENTAIWNDWQVEILATDVSESAIRSARKGCYNQFQIQRGLDIARMLRWFTETEDGWVASEKLRNRITYVTHNILETPPTTRRFDLVLCRNVLLYFDTATRKKAYARLDSALAEDGYLLLGGGEAVRGHTGLFMPEKGRPSFQRPAAASARSGADAMAAVR